MLRLSACLLCLSCWASAAEAQDLRLAVFDAKSNGGHSASIDGLLKGLRKHEYQAEAITDFGALTLAQYDILYLSDMHSPGAVRKDWRKRLLEFVRSGGSVLQTWHHHILPEVGRGVLRIYGSRRMHIVPGHPAVEGVPDFDASYRDHIIERVGEVGTVLIKNDAGQPVAAAGHIGKGKVISTGLALAIPNGGATREPRGAELKLLKAFLAWLVPETPRSLRSALVLSRPTLEVVPPERLVAAGFGAKFKARVCSPDGKAVQLTCDGAEPELTSTHKPAPDADCTISEFEVTVTPPPGQGGRHEHVVQAQIGDRLLEEKLSTTAVHGDPPPNEIRGVWLHVGADRHPRVVYPELKTLGINLAVLRIAGGTAAFYASKVQPDVQDPLAPDGDWLAETVKHAHANGIEIHPYFNNCVVEGRTSKKSLKRLRDAGRLQVGASGQPIDWFCPSQEINFAAIERPMVEVVTNYEVNGVQYDFIRYSGPQGCFCAKCRARFEEETGKPVAAWPTDVIDGPRKAEWIEYRCARISALVERISTRIRQIAPKVKISAAVFRDWPACRENNGQDWVRWCKEGWLDFVCPMNYTLDTKLFAERCAAHREAVPKGFPIVQGIGIASGQGSMKTSAEVAVQIAIARQHGAAGFVGFCYRPKHTSALLGPLHDWLRRPVPVE